MRAVRYHELGGEDVLRIESVDRPSPDDDELLVEMRAASVNPVDAKFRSGAYGDVTFPAVPGGDGAGVVEAVGDAVDGFEVGDRVFASGMGHADGGTTAEYVAFPAEKVAHLPDGIPFEVGGAIGNVGVTAWATLGEVAGLQTGDRVLIHGGGGGVGHVAVQLAASGGAEVIATVGRVDPDRVRALGADETFHYASDSLAEDVLAATGGDGVDVVLDHVLDQQLAVDLDVVATGGHVVTIMGDLPATSGAPLRDKEVTLRGINLGNRPERRSTLTRLARLMARDELTAVIADTYEMDEIRQAHRDVVDGDYLGKLVVLV